MSRSFRSLLGLSLLATACAVDSKPGVVPSASTFAARPEVASQPKELGLVLWRRDFQAAVEEAKRKSLPLFVLFDEVPGCSTVLAYGENVLSDPLIVEAIETYFVPVAIYNNVGGKDREILASFGEPSWNNPVVRLIDTERNPLAPRVSGDYTIGGLASAMKKAILATGKEPPRYLSVRAMEGTQEAQLAFFSMYCFWSGEALLGRIPGVTQTRTGFLNGSEVVEVTFNPKEISYEALVQAALGGRAASGVYTRTKEQQSTAQALVGSAATLTEAAFRPSEKDDKYSLRRSLWRFVPMTHLQATLANSMLANQEDPQKIFSPSQRALYQSIEEAPKKDWPIHLGESDLSAAFASTEALMK